MVKQILFLVLLITGGCKTNPVENQNKNFFSTGLLSIKLNDTITIAKINNKYFKIKYADYINEYARVYYTSYRTDKLDNIMGFDCRQIKYLKYPIQINLIMSVDTVVKIEVLLITPDKFYFRVVEYIIK